MKKLFLSSLLLVISLVAFAEDKISEYSMSYYSDQAYDIEASVPNRNGKFSFFVYAESKESDKHNVCGIEIRSTKVEEFKQAFKSIENKYQEWKATAEANKVTDFEKCFDIELPTVSGFFLYGSKWCFAAGYSFKPWFKVTKEGDCLVYFATAQMTADANRFMHYKGVMFAFKSIEEIEKFLKGLDSSKVLNKEAAQKEKDSLFK